MTCWPKVGLKLLQLFSLSIVYLLALLWRSVCGVFLMARKVVAVMLVLFFLLLFNVLRFGRS